MENFSAERRQQFFWLLFSDIPGWDEGDDDEFIYADESELIGRIPIGIKQNKERDHYVILGYMFQDRSFLKAVLSNFTESKQHKNFKFFMSGSYAINDHITKRFGVTRKIPTNNVDFVFDMSTFMLRDAAGRTPAGGWLTDEDFDDPSQGELKHFEPYSKALQRCCSRISWIRTEIIRNIRPVFPSLQRRFDQLFLELIDFNVSFQIQKGSKAQSCHIGFELLDPATNIVFTWNFLNMYIDWKSACKGVSRMPETELTSFPEVNGEEIRILNPIASRKDILKVYDRRKVTRRRLMAGYFDYTYERKKQGLGPDNEEEIDDYIEHLKSLDHVNEDFDIVPEDDPGEGNIVNDDEYITRYVNEDPDVRTYDDNVEDDYAGTDEQSNQVIAELEDDKQKDPDAGKSNLRWSFLKQKALEVYEMVQEFIQSRGEQP